MMRDHLLSCGLTVGTLADRIAVILKHTQGYGAILDVIAEETGNRPEVENPVLWVQDEGESKPRLVLVDGNRPPYDGIAYYLPDDRREAVHMDFSGSDGDEVAYMLQYAATYGDDDILDALPHMGVYAVPEDIIEAALEPVVAQLVEAADEDINDDNFAVEINPNDFVLAPYRIHYGLYEYEDFGTVEEVLEFYRRMKDGRRHND
jgi:hypothetical protein